MTSPTGSGPRRGFLGTDVDLDLSDRLLQRRIVLLTGPLDTDAATRAAARLMLLDAESADPVELHVGCPDGDLAAALVLAETIDLARAPVTAVLMGTVGGPVLAAVAAADRRVAHPSCRLVLREPRTSACGRADELTSAAEQHAQLVDELCARLAAAGGRSRDEVAADLRRGRVLSAREGVDYGLVHELLASRR